MSAPQTNLDKQRKRHWAPLLGMALAVLFGVGVIFYWLGEEVATSDPPEPVESESDTGAIDSTLPAGGAEPETPVVTTPAIPP